jgi:hypothetical protein
MPTAMPKEPKTRREPGEFADHDAEDELEAAKGWPVVRTLRRASRKDASETTEGTRGPQES